MNVRLSFVLPLAMLACATWFPASASPFVAALAPAGSELVGAWQLDVRIGPCGNPANYHEFLALQTFNLGGTLSGSDIHPSSGQGATQGVWSYDFAKRRYSARQQFPRFVNDVYDGLQDIRIANIRLSSRGEVLDGDVHAYMLNVDESVRVELCGVVTGERIRIDG